jgi:general secretion pathway protein C
MLARLFAFAIWTAVTASLMFWALRLFVTPQRAPAFTVSAIDGQGMRGDIARVFGSTPTTPDTPVAVAPPPAASRFKLVGVAAPRESSMAGGVALIAVDGKPARAITVGRSIDDGWVLQSVHRGGARLSSNLGASTIDLEVPALQVAQRGSLSPVSNRIEGPSPGGTPPTVAPLSPSTLPRAGGAFGAGAARAPAAPAMQAPAGAVTAPIAPAEGQPQPMAAPTGAPPAVFVPPEELTRQQQQQANPAGQQPQQPQPNPRARSGASRPELPDQ